MLVLWRDRINECIGIVSIVDHFVYCSAATGHADTIAYAEPLETRFNAAAMNIHIHTSFAQSCAHVAT
jgi:hypothetical protein